MASTGPSSPGQYPGSRASLAASTQSQWDLNSSIYSDDTGKDAAGAATGNKTRKPRWVGQVKRWLSVSEPSAQAMKEQKVSTYKRYGIDLDDPRAAAKMHFPIGKVPEGATTSTGGPNPEKVHKEQTRQKQARNSCMALSRGSQSINSNISSAASMREAKQLVPWGS